MRRIHDSESIGQFKLKKYTTDPVITEEGFIWYNETEKSFKCTILDTDGLTVTTKKVVDENVLAAEGAGLPTGASEGDVLINGESGPEWGPAPDGLPSGGSSGDVLFNGESGPEWDTAPVGVPTGASDGYNGDVLHTDGEGSIYWDDLQGVPSGGSSGDILFNGESGHYWDDADEVFPSGASDGDVLSYDSENGPSWAPPEAVPTGGSDGDVLHTDGEGYIYWDDVLPSGGSEGDVLFNGESGPEWDTSPVPSPDGIDKFLGYNGSSVVWEYPIKSYTETTTTAATTHTITHNLYTDSIQVTVWVDVGGEWTIDNTSVTSIVSIWNQLTVTLTTSANIRVVVIAPFEFPQT